MAISGQEQQKYGFPSRKGGGLLGEVTLVTLYKAALTAGKAYTNHKHHHVHHFHHEDKAGEDDYDINPSMTPAAPPLPPSAGTQFPFLSNGQLLPMLPITELTAFRGPGGSKNINLFTPFNSHIDILLPGMQRLFKRDQGKQISTPGKRTKKSENHDDDEDVADAEVDDILKATTKELRKVKREASEMEQAKRVVFKEDDILKEDEGRSMGLKKRQTLEGMEMGDEKNQKKRTIFNEQFQFGLIPGDDLSGLFPGDGYVLGGGGLKFEGEERNKLAKPAEPQVQMEPAEWEVRRIMAVCSGCSEDPFRKASIISWRESPKKVYAGAHYVPATPECQRF